MQICRKGNEKVNEIASSGVIAKDSNLKIGYPVNVITPGNSSGIVDTMTNSEATLQNGADSINGCDGLFLGSFVRSSYPVSRGTVSSHSQRDIFLCSLRDFIAQKGGCLGEGWHVEFKQSANESDSYAVYCAPDGRKFESVFDVARYLGVTSNAQSIESEKRGDTSGLVQRPLPSRRRKKEFSKISASEISLKNLESIPSNFDEEHSSDTEILEPQFSSVRIISRVTNNVTVERCVSDSESLPASLPIQFEDFFVCCFGKIDLRTAYHNSSQIWPVGYKSIWHDKITGSVFECEVFDGGDSGPVFRVKRLPCSLSPIPDAETSILCNTSTKAGVAVRMDGSVSPSAECDRDDDILMLICDTSPADNNLSSLFSGDIGDSPYACSSPVDMMKSGVSTSSHDSCYVERCGTCSLVDDIGEFYVEGRSSAAVWKMVSETVIDICHEVFRKLGRVQFSCRHDGRDFPSSYCKDFPYGADNSSSKNVHSYGSLARFSCASGPKNAPLVYNNNVLESSCKALSEWLDKDRSGLDVGFVQEMLETLPKSRACPKYQFLKDRSDSFSSWTIGSGQLVAVPKNVEKGEKVAIDCLHERSKCSPLPKFEEPQACLRRLPHGQPLSNKLPRGLVGDVYQIWEFLCRFHEILGLKETLKFDELEEELVDPWPCVRGNLSSSEKHSHDSKDGNSQVNGSTVRSLSAHESWEGFDRDNTSTFIPVENSVVREASQAKLAARTYGRCTGLTLSKIHTSLLKVLVGELLNKVAVYVNPNFDAKESKSRRGRKKDLDNSHIKEAKLETLNFNEFTWPELARRYVLSILSMNMCMDSSEAHSREGAKVFRCLRGDGGILCGSFSGIAAMETDALADWIWLPVKNFHSDVDFTTSSPIKVCSSSSTAMVSDLRRSLSLSLRLPLQQSRPQNTPAAGEILPLSLRQLAPPLSPTYLLIYQIEDELSALRAFHIHPEIEQTTLDWVSSGLCRLESLHSILDDLLHLPQDKPPSAIALPVLIAPSKISFSSPMFTTPSDPPPSPSNITPHSQSSLFGGETILMSAMSGRGRRNTPCSLVARCRAKKEDGAVVRRRRPFGRGRRSTETRAFTTPVNRSPRTETWRVTDYEMKEKPSDQSSLLLIPWGSHKRLAASFGRRKKSTLLIDEKETFDSAWSMTADA
ncbi:Methyl-CpG-binding domain-containing protein 9 [Platanthera guangdongensis]|uniref:Methyl-CpG-binding domain-containing protein 9 n=1 Tax=Platanthera guangdongensis TaxID=2320717 RepID=A0ABR2MEW7_9ASPA